MRFQLEKNWYSYNHKEANSTEYSMGQWGLKYFNKEVFIKIRLQDKYSQGRNLKDLLINFPINVKQNLENFLTNNPAMRVKT